MAHIIWWNVDRLIDEIIPYVDPIVAFRCRLVNRKWYFLVSHQPSCVWRNIFLSLVPSTRLSTLLLENFLPGYKKEKEFDRLSLIIPLDELTIIHHVAFFTISLKPIVWLVDVPAAATRNQLLCRCEDLCEERATLSGPFLANGVELHDGVRLCDHIWPTRCGKKGWPYDLVVICCSAALLQLEPSNEIVLGDKTITKSSLVAPIAY